MSSHAEHPPHAGPAHHGGNPAHFTRNLLALLFLTVVTVGASYIDFGPANVAIAMAIATLKAALVALFFMQLFWDKPVNAIIGVAGFIFLGLLLLFTFLDVGTRRDPQPRNLAPMTDQQNPTPVPPTMNPLLTPPPQPLPAATKGKEGGIAVEH
jgi:cytochrome c oxidase subunit 4